MRGAAAPPLAPSLGTTKPVCEHRGQLQQLRMIQAWQLANKLATSAHPQPVRSRTSITVAILAQGTSWAVADTQAFLPSGSIPMRVQGLSATACSRSAASVVLLCARELHAASSTPCARNGLEHKPHNGLDVVMCCATVCHAK